MQIAHLGQVSELASQDTQPVTAQLGLRMGRGCQGEPVRQPHPARVGWEVEIMCLPQASQPARRSREDRGSPQQ